MRGLRTAVRFPTPAIWTSGSFYRQPRFIPRPPSAVERDRFLIAHLLQSIGDQRRAKSAAAIQHHGGRFAGNFRLDIALDDALAQVDRAGRVTGGPFVVFARVDQYVIVGLHLLVLLDVDLFHTRLRIVHQRQKTGIVLLMGCLMWSSSGCGRPRPPASIRFSHNPDRCDRRDPPQFRRWPPVLPEPGKRWRADRWRSPALPTAAWARRRSPVALPGECSLPCAPIPGRA